VLLRQKGLLLRNFWFLYVPLQKKARKSLRQLVGEKVREIRNATKSAADVVAKNLRDWCVHIKNKTKRLRFYDGEIAKNSGFRKMCDRVLSQLSSMGFAHLKVELKHLLKLEFLAMTEL